MDQAHRSGSEPTRPRGTDPAPDMFPRDKTRAHPRFWPNKPEIGRIHALPPHFVESQCQPLMDPPMVPASEAVHMRDDDVVLGLEMDGEYRAYPWWIMDNHHVANDTLAGQPVTIVLCEMCSTGICFDPVVRGRRLTFQNTHMFKRTVGLQDHQTESFWSTYLARAIAGPLEGENLQLFPIVHIEWGEWRRLHPETLVLADGLGSRTGHGSEDTIGSPLPDDANLPADTRLPHNTLVLGVRSGPACRVYPLDELRARSGVVEDELGGVPIVVFAHLAKGSYAALAFSRVLEGRVLTFTATDEGPVDTETSSVWRHDGLAVQGPLTGKRLSFVDSHVSEYYLWPLHFPDVEIAFSEPPSAS